MHKEDAKKYRGGQKRHLYWIEGEGSASLATHLNR